MSGPEQERRDQQEQYESWDVSIHEHLEEGILEILLPWKEAKVGKEYISIVTF